MKSFRLIELDWPTTPEVEAPPTLPVETFRERIDSFRKRMAEAAIDIALVYADREHFANLHYLTHFDPRFEETLLVVAANSKPLILVGNECQSYLPISPLWRSGELRMELFRQFSLEDQTRTTPRTLTEILREEGCKESSRVALIGSKTYTCSTQSDIPSYIVDSAREIAGWQNCTNQSGWLVDSDTGLRSTLSADDIAIFEINNIKASEAIRRMHFALRPGITDHQLMAEAVHYDGTPLSCHMTCKTGPNRISLASASGNLIEVGHTWSANVAYWGSNVCRANWIARDKRDLPAAAQDYLEAFAGPYFLAVVSWLESLDLGADCGQVHDQTLAQLPHDIFHVELNPGHHIGYDEWPSSSFYQASKVKLRSGMVLQSDIIPGNPVYFSTRMEDGYAIADAPLRNEIATRFPSAWKRIGNRRAFLSNQLGIHLHECVLPLSNTAGMIAPWGLSPRSIIAKG